MGAFLVFGAVVAVVDAVVVAVGIVAVVVKLSNSLHTCCRSASCC